MRALIFSAIVLLSAAAHAAGVRVPSVGLPSGASTRTPLFSAPAPSLGAWNVLRGYGLTLGARLPGAAHWAAAEGEQGRLAATLLHSRLPKGFLADALRLEALTPARREEMAAQFLAAHASAADEADLAALQAVMRFQLSVDQGKAASGDLFELESQLRSLSLYGGKAVAVHDEIRAAAAVQRGHQVLRAFKGRFGAGLEDDDAAPASEGSGSAALAPAEAKQEAAAHAAQPPAPSAGVLDAHVQPQGRAWWRYTASWAGPILAGAALTYGLDFTTKILALQYLPTLFHESAWRGPFLYAIVPLILAAIFMARSGLEYTRSVPSWALSKWRNGWLGWHRKSVAGLDEMMQKHPSLAAAKRLYGVAIALMIGGMLGNAIDVWVKGGALDFIPFGRSTLNFADVALLLGLAYFQMAGRFFVRAAEAFKANKPLDYDAGSYMALPLAGFVAAWIFGSVPNDQFLSLTMSHVAWIYVMGFSMLLGVSRIIALIDVRRYVRRFREESGK